MAQLPLSISRCNAGGGALVARLCRGASTTTPKSPTIAVPAARRNVVTQIRVKRIISSSPRPQQQKQQELSSTSSTWPAAALGFATLSTVASCFYYLNEEDQNNNNNNNTILSHWRHRTHQIATSQMESSSDSHHDNHHQHQRTNLARMAPLLPVRIFQYNPHLQVAFDTRQRTPVYVLERLVVQDTDNNADKKKKNNKQRPKFFVEPNLPEHFQSRNAHYQNTGYDRGHMAPAADFNFEEENDNSRYNNKNKSATMDYFGQTFCLTNTCPQDSQLNRGLWAQLEDWTRRVAQHYHDVYNNKHNNNSKTVSTYAVTGPLWLPKRQLEAQKFQYQYPALGQPPELVAVPTHLFKIVVVVKEDQQSDNSDSDNGIDQTSVFDSNDIVAFACFVIPNEAPPPRDDKASLAKYLVCWTDLEAATGLEFFGGHQNKHWKTFANDLTLREMQGEPLLLPDGKRNNYSSPRSWGYNKNRALHHLCSKGNCDLARRVFRQ